MRDGQRSGLIQAQVTDTTDDVFLADSTGTSQNPYWLSFVRKDRLADGLIDTVHRDLPAP